MEAILSFETSLHIPHPILMHGLSDCSSPERTRQVLENCLKQWFSTWGVFTHGGTQRHLTLYVKLKKIFILFHKHLISSARFRTGDRRPGHRISYLISKSDDFALHSGDEIATYT
jgi:hypothetical protein